MPASPCGPSLCPVLLPLPAFHGCSSLTKVPLTKLQLSACFQRALTATERGGAGGCLCNRFNQRGGGFRPTSKGNENDGENLIHRSLCQGPGVALRVPSKPAGRVLREPSASLPPEHVASMNSPEWATLQARSAPYRGWGWHRSPWARPSAPLLFVGAGTGFAGTSPRNLAVSTPLERASLQVWFLSYSQGSQK